jgi:hypothetical protein
MEQLIRKKCEDESIKLTYEIKPCSLKPEETSKGRIFLHEFLFLMYNSHELEDSMEKANIDPCVPKICYNDILEKTFN